MSRCQVPPFVYLRTTPPEYGWNEGNAFNQFQLVGTRDSRIFTALNNPGFQIFDPFTTMPVRGVHWDTAPDFDDAVSADSYTMPRTFLITFGARF